jgi:hypothetical protein
MTGCALNILLKKYNKFPASSAECFLSALRERSFRIAIDKTGSNHFAESNFYKREAMPDYFVRTAPRTGIRPPTINL